MGGQRQSGPTHIVNFMVDHARFGLTLRYLHGEHEFHLPAHFVEDVRYTVATLRNIQGAVREGAGIVAQVQSTLVHDEQFPDGDTAVDNILTVIAGVVPAFGHVKAVVTGTAPAGHVVVTFIRTHVEVSCRPCPLGIGGVTGVAATGIRRLNRDTAAVVIEVFDGIIKHTAESVCGDIKGITLVTAHMKLIAGGRGGDGTDVNKVNVVP